MNYDVHELEQIVRTNVSGLVETAAFKDWLEKQRPKENDIILLNNSYIFRSSYISTPKNEKYLCIRVEKRSDGTLDLSDVMVIKPTKGVNSDFHLLSGQQQDLPMPQALDVALEEELEHLGKLIFVLIGELEDRSTEVPLNHSTVKQLKFDPGAAFPVAIEVLEGQTLAIVINQISDPGKAWEIIEAELADEINDFLSLKKSFDPAFEKLQDTAHIILQLPSSTSSATSHSFLRRVRESVSQQRLEYEQSLQNCIDADGTDNIPGKEVMRIAYNFADDAVKVLQVLVSISDLKAVLQWCTIREHFDVTLAFQALPWTRSDKKPSMGNYQNIVGGARNHAFHNLFNFDRTVVASLEGVVLGAKSLTLLPRFTRRKSTVSFDYDDRELVEVLSGFSTSAQMAVSLEFWVRNRDVMESFEKLLEQSESALWALHRALVS